MTRLIPGFTVTTVLRRQKSRAILNVEDQLTEIRSIFSIIYGVESFFDSQINLLSGIVFMVTLNSKRICPVHLFFLLHRNDYQIESN